MKDPSREDGRQQEQREAGYLPGKLPSRAFAYRGLFRKVNLIMISGSNENFRCQRLFLRRRFADNRRVFTRTDSLDRSDKPVASPRQRLDETGIGGQISQYFAKFVNASAQAVVKINECVLGPKRAAEFLARN